MGDPTRPTQPLGGQPPPPAERAVAHEREVVGVDPTLLEELRRIRFWSYFGSAVGAAAAILAAIALIAALQADGGSSDESAQPALSGLRSDVSNLRSDVSELRSSTQETSQQVDSLSRRVRELEQSSKDAASAEEDISQLQQDLADLTDRLDQVEQAQEEAASGGP
jgi:hypothetical protein